MKGAGMKRFGRAWLVFALFTLLVAIALAAGCGTTKTGGETTTDQPENSSENIQTKVGSEFTVWFDSNRSTGYQWVLAGPVDPKMLESESARYIQSNLKVGAPGREMWKFKAVGEGNTEIDFEYRRPWEQGAAPARTRKVIVEVKPGATGEEQVFTDPNVPIETAAGQRFLVKLESNPTTGYQWQLASDYDEKVLQLLDSEYIPPQEAVPGAGGEETWRFEALGAGETKISLNYARSWEKDTPPARTAVFNVTVK